MIDPARREVLRALEELSDVCPEYRFGQMIANLVMLGRGDAEGAALGDGGRGVPGRGAAALGRLERAACARRLRRTR